MAAACELEDTNEETMYRFRFGTSNKIIDLTEEQLHRIPYLSLLVTHNEDFSSVQNEDGEYVLNSRIRSNWFLPIFQFIKTGNPSALFTELPKEAYVWGMLQLYDYLGLDAIPVPLLKDQCLVRTNPENIDAGRFRVEYSRAENLLGVRDTAAQFTIALSKTEYNLADSTTLWNIFSLIMDVISNPNIFGVRLCYHLLTVTKKVCFSLFSSAQQWKLQKAEKSIENTDIHSSIYFRDGQQTLPKDLENVFVWKGIYVPIEEKSRQSDDSKSSLEYRFHDVRYLLSDWDFDPSSIYNTRVWPTYAYILPIFPGIVFPYTPVDQELIQAQRKLEAKSARSGYFNTLPKQPTVDKFKHRCGPKAQKHR